MRRALSWLLCAGFLLSLGLLMPERASAHTGGRHGPAASHAGWTKRPHIAGREHRLRPHERADRRLSRPRHVEGFRKHRHSYFPHRSWSWPYVARTDDRPLILEREAAPNPVLLGIPSIADLPVSAGIRSAPAAPPTVYVLGGGKRSLRRGSGAKVLTTQSDDAEVGPSPGPRIIHLNVPRR